MSISGPNPVTFSPAIIRMIYQYSEDFSEKLLNEKLAGLDPDVRRDVIVAMTTAFHEGARVGFEYARLGGSLPYEIQ